MKARFLFSVALLCLGACSYREEKVAKKILTESPSFVSVSEQIFKPNCYSCHLGANAAQGVDLSDYRGLLSSGAGVISEGEPLNSTLYLNIQSGRMPPGGPRLSDSEIKMVYEWIKAGAKEN